MAAPILPLGAPGKLSSLQGLQKCCRENFVLKPCVEVAMKFVVKFCCSSFLRKRSSKVPGIFHDKFHGIFHHAIFHQTLCNCKCPISRRFSFCRRLSLKNAFFLQENLHAHEIPCFRGGGILGFFEGGSADFTFMGARIFLIFETATPTYKVKYEEKYDPQTARFALF